MKRLAVFLAALVFSWMTVRGQGSAWLEVPDPATGVSVEMPVLPGYGERNFYSEGQAMVKQIFSCKHGRLEFYFESIPLAGTGRKAVSGAIDRTIDLLAIERGGTPGKPKSHSRNGVAYSYVEILSSGGTITRSILFDSGDRLLHIYLFGPRSEAFEPDADHYLESWKPGAVSTVEEPGSFVTEQEVGGSEETFRPELWEIVTVNEDLKAAFPDKPFRRTTVIEQEQGELVITAYSRYSEAFDINYVLTHRVYDSASGFQGDNELYAHLLEEVIRNNRLKLIRESVVMGNGFEGRQYVLSRGIRFYRLQLFRIGDTVYQALAKGKRRNIDQPEIDYFFNALIHTGRTDG